MILLLLTLFFINTYISFFSQVSASLFLAILLTVKLIIEYFR